MERRLDEQQVDAAPSSPRASSTSASQGPVSPEKTSDPPPSTASVTRIAYASTGWSTAAVATRNGPMRCSGCQVR